MSEIILPELIEFLVKKVVIEDIDTDTFSLDLSPWRSGSLFDNFVVELEKHIKRKYNPLSKCNIIVSVNGSCVKTTVKYQMYLGGRYLKLKRNISQTPWALNKTSVSGCICEVIKTVFGTESAIFTASGREDSNVRMLGDGRPFYLTLLNPIRTNTTLSELEDKINSTFTDQIQVIKLSWVSKSDLGIIKDGENSKTKVYSMLLWSDDPIDFNMLEFDIEQRTPIRVLHRRANLVRTRRIHVLDVVKISDKLMRAQMEAEAGTYVKEFVTGDLGRTIPSLGKLMEREVDILELDVIKVNLDWPPFISGPTD